MHLYKLPFSRGYWREAAASLRSIRLLALAALLMAAASAISAFYIPLPGNLRVLFTYVPRSLCAVLCGPLLGMIYGFSEDLLGYLLHPTGVFFPGYTLSSVLSMLVYALFLYRAKISVARIFLCKAVINFCINVGLGVWWSSILFGKGYLYFFWTSLTKNALLLPVETVILAAVFRLLLPALEKQGLTPPQGQPRLPLFGRQSR